MATPNRSGSTPPVSRPDEGTVSRLARMESALSVITSAAETLITHLITHELQVDSTQKCEVVVARYAVERIGAIADAALGSRIYPSALGWSTDEAEARNG